MCRGVVSVHELEAELDRPPPERRAVPRVPSVRQRKYRPSAAAAAAAAAAAVSAVCIDVSVL